jgi:hypothetical protein
MTKGSTLERTVVLASVVPAAILLASLLAGHLPVSASRSVPAAMEYVAALPKLCLLLLGTWFAIRNARHFEARSKVALAWWGFALGLALFFVGQAYYAPYQLIDHTSPPFPSAGDIFFMLGYPCFTYGLLGLGQAYEAAGFPAGPSIRRLVPVWWLVTIFLLVGALVLVPVWRGRALLGVKLLNSAYPILDLVLLFGTARLIRLTLPLRGGAIWRAWAAFLGGFAFMAVGDLIFAWVSGLGSLHLDPLVHTTYVLSYGLIALGVIRQERLAGV